jgi:hypothetical protein
LAVNKHSQNLTSYKLLLERNFGPYTLLYFRGFDRYINIIILSRLLVTRLQIIIHNYDKVQSIYVAEIFLAFPLQRMQTDRSPELSFPNLFPI